MVELDEIAQLEAATERLGRFHDEGKFSSWERCC